MKHIKTLNGVNLDVKFNIRIQIFMHIITVYKFRKYTTSACIPEECVSDVEDGAIQLLSSDTNTICSVFWEKGFLAASFTNHKQKWSKQCGSNRTEMFFFFFLSLLFIKPLYLSLI